MFLARRFATLKISLCQAKAFCSQHTLNIVLLFHLSLELDFGCVIDLELCTAHKPCEHCIQTAYTSKYDAIVSRWLDAVKLIETNTRT